LEILFFLILRYYYLNKDIIKIIIIFNFILNVRLFIAFEIYRNNMKTTQEHNERMAKMTFASVYPHYVNKVVSKGRTKEELHQVIKWLTGFDDAKIFELIEQNVTFEEFFEKAQLNPNAHLIKGVICGYRIEEIENELTRKIRYLDKLVDELAKGKKMGKILRTGE
jgi:hypothetical protein